MRSRQTGARSKVAFVTGGGRGIGAAIVRRLAHDGATVEFTYQRSAASACELVNAIETSGGRAIAFQADVADAVPLSRAINYAAYQLGRIDILVNNADCCCSVRWRRSHWKTST